MKDWLRGKNSFTKWTAIGTAASAATGIFAVDAIIIALIAAYMLGQSTFFGIPYPPVLDKIGEVALYVIGVSIVGFLISITGLIASLFVGPKTGQEQTGE